jgi:TolA-binding protein
MKRSRMNAAFTIAVASLVLGASFNSCAYFNTLYNARKLYKEAEKAGEKGGGGKEQREKYKHVIEKCAQLIQDYPKSRWVDDAAFLMGMALVRQEEYDKGIRKFLEILANFPESGYVPEAIYWISFSYYKKDDYNLALSFTERLLKEYPKSELRYQALFLGGDIKRELEDYEGALEFYGRVADAASKKEIIDEARLKSAELFYARHEWDKAGASYEKLLGKGITWEKRYTISLALGDCYARTGKCRDALLLFDGLLAKATAVQDIPSLLLGRAESYVCMDSLGRAFSVYDEVIVKYPKSTYSAQAYYRKGVIYHEKLDSLRAAQEAFSKVSGEYASSEYAAVSLEKSSSMNRLLELQQSAGGAETSEQAAEKRLMAAEIQLTRLGNVPVALAGYASMLDSFPETDVAPKAAYAIAWIHQYRLNEKDTAIARYRFLVEQYPRSPQARGALFQLGYLGATDLKGYLSAFVDSVRADTTAAQKTASVAAALPDSLGAAKIEPPPVSPDTTGRARIEPPSAPLDTTGRVRIEPPPVSPDTTSRARIEPPSVPLDTTGRARKGGAG